ncbi:polyprenyl synthetase family protein [Nonomuraea sp. NPDC050783]|uniref:polyprenyl synthetase family protein n=1 Tax=Nonomuraea sp. NPDC050783 TaxID=3154634 RepID=UPI0034661E59
MKDEVDLAGIRRDVEGVLRSFLDEKHRAIPHPRARPLVEHLRGLLDAGGKRLRPVLCVVGWHAAGRTGVSEEILHLAAAVEMFHAAAMIHDDIIDRSATRRGAPSAYHALRAHCPAPAGSETAWWFGVSAALILGDLALSWSDELAYRGQPDMSRLRDAFPPLNALRAEALTGAYVELLATGQYGTDIELAMEINRLKSAKYTVERPLHLGAALGGAEPAVLKACTAYGIPLGEAFQLRDELLGVFGHVPHTGKPALDDLREGKPTVLLTLALRNATPIQGQRLRSLIGDPHLDEESAGTVREILVQTGARREVERLIDIKRQQAVRTLTGSGFPPPVISALRQLAEAATRRTA